MRTPKVRRPLGADWRTEASPFGNRGHRTQWSERIDALATLDVAVALLIGFRAEHVSSLTDLDALWIEARLEERVAVLRFAERSYQELRTLTLTGETIADVQARYEGAAKAGDAAALEALAAEFRGKYKPPIMPSSPYLQTETIISEQLMKRRSLDWFGPSIVALRANRSVTVLKEGWPDLGDDTSGTP
jgi:methane monooxygenase component A gamma chain